MARGCLFCCVFAYVAQTAPAAAGLYRRMPSCRVSTIRACIDLGGTLPISNRRYGRLAICATLNGSRDVPTDGGFHANRMAVTLAPPADRSADSHFREFVAEEIDRGFGAARVGMATG